MASKETVPGLMSKVAKFVRNPTKDWAELDDLGNAGESSYDKQALKEMIERKRQNDFVRRREFDELRKLRSRQGSSAGSMGRSSAFQSSVNSDPDGRAVTLKKIDEIEAQMSKQWWKGKMDPQAAFAPTQPHALSTNTSASTADQTTLPANQGSTNFKLSGASGIDFQSTDIDETQLGESGGQRRSAAQEKPARQVGREVEFSTTDLFALEDALASTDPELEEAAIRYANSDDAGAEASLLQALRVPALPPNLALTWVAALLDLYRSTQQRDKFDQALVQYSKYLEKHSPVWDYTASAVVSQDAPKTRHEVDTLPSHLKGESAGKRPHWVAPATLTADAMEALRGVLGAHPMPWHLDWTPLQNISPQAMPLLCGLFASLCEEPVGLQFDGARNLAQTLGVMTPSRDRSVDEAWWLMRLDALRVMQMIDEFEMVALDYCVTYEVSPPAWKPARCTWSTAAANAFDTTTRPALGGDAAHSAITPLAEKDLHTLHLRGEILGDATAHLTDALGVQGRSGPIIVSCAQLVRVDFSAAGSILNWVAKLHAEGCQVQFSDVHRLVAAFFNVIGLAEHARVATRPI